MKRLLALIVCCYFCNSSVYSQTESGYGKKQSKLEAFADRSGRLIKKKFTSAGPIEDAGSTIENTNGGRCVGAINCTACTSCRYCKHCNSGGSCGVCGGGTKIRGAIRSYPKVPDTRSSRGMHENYGIQYFVKARWINVRSGPGTGFIVIDRIDNLTPVTVGLTHNGWCHIFYQKGSSRNGYVLRKYLSSRVSIEYK